MSHERRNGYTNPEDRHKGEASVSSELRPGTPKLDWRKALLGVVKALPFYVTDVAFSLGLHPTFRNETLQNFARVSAQLGPLINGEPLGGSYPGYDSRRFRHHVTSQEAYS